MKTTKLQAKQYQGVDLTIFNSPMQYIKDHRIIQYRYDQFGLY